MYIAHINDKSEEQSVLEHLNGVEKLCREWAIPPIKDLAATAGKLHDVGKYSQKFQEKIAGNDHIQVEHAICGAKEVAESLGKNSPYTTLLQYVIAGHHTGLPDGGTNADTEDEPTLKGRLKRKTEDYSACRNEVVFESPTNEAADYFFKDCPKNKDGQAEMIERFAFLTKYVFSCLTDADYIDTERFCQPDSARGMGGDFSKALERVNEKLGQFSADTTVKAARAALQKQAFENIDSNSDISFLQMPTGSGKTLCSLKLALEYAIKNGKERIIYVIPYTSIIEQTADIFSKLLGDSVEILEHHSNYDFEENKNNKFLSTTAEKLRKSCENWDAKLIVTTNTQFFQSLYHYKGSRLRKLHNLANSVLVFDEIHTLPINNLQPCLRGIGYITKYLNSHAIFLSATMPDFMEYLTKYANMAKIRELITDKSCFDSFKNCKYTFIGHADHEKIAFEAAQCENALCVVNTRKAARELYSVISGKKYHLSTFMTPVNRSETIQKIRNAIDKKEPFTVVSTSLIEAGVDLDFAAVFRQLSGLDSILQAGGRCNREGMRKNSQVFIFEGDDTPKKGEIPLRSEIAKGLMKEYEDISSVECIKKYYERLLKKHSDVIERNSIYRFNENNFDGNGVRIDSIPFRSYANYFNYIESEAIAVVIPHTKDTEELLKRAEFDKSAKRKLQRYSVSVYPNMLRNLIERGIVSEQSGMYVLSSMQYYSEETGLSDEIDDENYIC